MTLSSQREPEPSKTTSVIFLCPHNAAKSVAAAAMFRQVAESAGLDVTVTTAGTAPDREVMPAVRGYLEVRGLRGDSLPRKVTAEDLAVDHIVNIGCDVADLPTEAGTDVDVESWDRVPMVSEGLEAAMASIEAHVERFVARLGASA